MVVSAWSITKNLDSISYTSFFWFCKPYRWSWGIGFLQHSINICITPQFNVLLLNLWHCKQLRLQSIILSWRMNWEIYGKKLSWPSLKHNSNICLLRIRKTTTSQDSECPGQDTNVAPPKYKWEVLLLWSTSTVSMVPVYSLLAASVILLQ